jgi:hypothetical protein
VSSTLSFVPLRTWEEWRGRNSGFPKRASLKTTGLPFHPASRPQALRSMKRARTKLVFLASSSRDATLYLAKKHICVYKCQSCRSSCRSYDSILLLGDTSLTNGLEFEQPWLSEPSQPVSRMQTTKRRIEQFSVHTSCSKATRHVPASGCRSEAEETKHVSWKAPLFASVSILDFCSSGHHMFLP